MKNKKKKKYEGQEKKDEEQGKEEGIKTTVTMVMTIRIIATIIAW